MVFQKWKLGNSNETFEFKNKFIWNPPKWAVALELFLSQAVKDISVKDVSILPGKTTNYNLSKYGYLTMFILQNSKSVDIKPASKKYAEVLWARTDYLKKAETQLSDE